MRILAAASALVAVLILAPAAASAQERLGDGVMGALAGALVGGPVGAVVGGGIGYAAGPRISRSFSGGSRHRYRRPHASRYRGRTR